MIALHQRQFQLFQVACPSARVEIAVFLWITTLLWRPSKPGIIGIGLHCFGLRIPSLICPRTPMRMTLQYVLNVLHLKTL